MSYKALLFCPDEDAARLVTQVLSELEFTVELSFEPFVTVKKLTDEPFDALVVDCANDENASVLFKGARNSTLNHSSLCVAVAEGQAGVAKAFKIGANLVLTKPINIEQSKNTLRVARGLLRKNTGGAKSAGEQSHSQPATLSTPPSISPAITAPAPTPAAPAPVVSAPHPVPSSPFAPSPLFAASSSGAAAAPALAPERPHIAPVAKSVPEIRSAPPLATQDVIIPEKHFPELEPPAPSPALPSYTAYRPVKSGSGGKFVWVALVLLVVGAGGYFGWKKIQPLRYLHRTAPATTATENAPKPAAVEEKPSPDTALEPPVTSGSPAAAGNTNSTVVTSSPSALNAAEGFPTRETIVVSTPDEVPEHVTVTPKPIQVSKKSAPHEAAQEQQPAAAPAPPSLALTGTNTQDSTLAGIISTPTTVVPTAAPQTLRISQGITQGLLVKRVPPSYPPTAIQMRKEGIVELIATISKTGAISKIRVLSGDATLAKAAVDAVHQWKYRPYLLNNEPVEIETQITVNFKLPR
ncbi:MAG TPA: TonB family protein [Terriglobales bacterium]|nr:TonB family protein [Terriglobales bacterium]